MAISKKTLIKKREISHDITLKYNVINKKKMKLINKVLLHI